MNAQDLMRQRMLEALAGQDSLQKSANDEDTSMFSDKPATNQAEQFQKLPPDLQSLSIQGGQGRGRQPFAGLNLLSGYMRDANYEGIDARDQDFQDNNKDSNQIKWERIKSLLAGKSSQ